MKKLNILFAVLGLLVFMIGNADAAVVTTSGRTILVDGSPYVIKGICYNPVPKGSDQRSWATLTQDLALMNEAGINTIRVYSPIDEKEVLDEIAAAGIKVIIGFGYNMNGYYDILSGSFIDYIKKYKDHEAILIWEFGNEYNYHPEWFEGDITNWYTALNNAAADSKFEDSNHPTGTAHGELPNSTALISCSNVDVWGLNVYRWDDPGPIFSEWSSASKLPMYLSEAGADRFMKVSQNGYEAGENEKMQADATKNILDKTFARSDVCSGVALFEFSDEWWKAGNPANHDEGGWAPNSNGVPYDGAPNEEYWGIVDIDRNKMEAFEVVKTKYKSIIVSNKEVISSEGLQVYPNPSTGTINITVESEQLVGMKYYVVNSAGVVVYEGSTSIASQEIQIDKQGVYFLQVVTEVGVANKKFSVL